MWKFGLVCQVVVKKNEIMYVSKLFQKIKENSELWGILIISQSLNHPFSPLQAALSCTYCGQEGIQEAARKDSASGKGRAEM